MNRKKTKIICTIGPATESKEMIKKLALNGMDIARLNFSHGDHQEHLRRINRIKQIREEINIPIAILLDTKGPEIRTKLLKDDSVVLKKGNQFTLTSEDILGDETRVSITYNQLTNDVICEVISGGELGNRKGINIPNVKLKLPPITDKDKEDIIFGINHGIDFLAASFVRNKDAIKEIRKIVKDCNSDLAIIAKIENREGLDNIEEIIDASDGIMVARGDLGVEIEAESLPFIQKQIIRKCNEAFKPVITATQMLDSMIRHPRPTRAEATDVANSIYDGTDAIMLSGETAMGKYPLDAVKMMVKIAKETEAHLDYDGLLRARRDSRKKSISSAVCFSAVTTAMNINAKLIVASSFSGFTTRVISKFRSESIIIGLSPLNRTLRKMQLYWGVTPLQTNEVNSTDHLLEEAIKTLTKNELAESGDMIILTAGVPAGKTGVTNMIKVVEIE
jgi:pyruvate kinase